MIRRSWKPIDEKVEQMTSGQRFLFGMGVGALIAGVVELILKVIA